VIVAIAVAIASQAYRVMDELAVGIAMGPFPRVIGGSGGSEASRQWYGPAYPQCEGCNREMVHFDG
jgi:hypothetical protein